MTTRVDLTGVQDAYHLCYVRPPWAYFTRLPLDQQWGDRWERAPYGPEAGLPYSGEPDQILKVAFEGPLLTPEAFEHLPAYSVREINDQRAPWLSRERQLGGPPVDIMAGATLQRFMEQVELTGGTVYAPLGWGELPELPHPARTVE